MPEEPTTDYIKLNKLGKIPSFQGSDGYDLTEAIAIAIYSLSNLPFLLVPAAQIFVMRIPIKYSYPCLKTTVEKYSHSDTAI